MRQIAIIGAGVSGLACARALPGAVVFDKGRKAGGRLATRRGAGERTFNHGCQFATLRDAGFAAVMRDAGAEPWAAAGDGRFAAADMAGLAERLSAGLDVRLGAAVTGIAPGADGWRLAFADGAERIFGGLVLAVPAPQAAALLRPVGHGFVGRLEGVVMAPCWTLMLGFEGALPGPDVVRPEAGPVAWIARENSRPKAAAGPVGYTVQASPEWSRAHLEDAPEDVVAALTAAFVAASGVAVGPAHAVAHRWRYARAEVALGEDFLWDAALQVGVCGDWCLAGRLEAAYLSGNALGIRLAHEF